MQVTVGNKDGKTHSVELEENEINAIKGKRIGQEFDGSVLGLDGYTLEITGGSDKDGFPMKKNLQGTARRKVLIKKGIGVKKLRSGERKRKSMRGNAVDTDIAQLNTKVVEEGSESIDTLLNPDENDEEDEEK